MVWSNLCPIYCGNTGRLLRDLCKYAGERIVAHGPLISDDDSKLTFDFFRARSNLHSMHLYGENVEKFSQNVFKTNG